MLKDDLEKLNTPVKRTIFGIFVFLFILSITGVTTLIYAAVRWAYPSMQEANILTVFVITTISQAIMVGVPIGAKKIVA